MIFYILISVVFFAELIIAFSVVQYICKMRKKVIESNSLINEINPKIKDTVCVGRKISEQLVELSPIWVENIKSLFVKIIMGQMKNILGALTFWAVKTEVEKHMSK